jgi:HAD superfamily hydrolase (TIGR01459 family)
MKVITSLLQISDQADAFFIDVYGVLWSGEVFYPQALEVCQKLIEIGKKIYILSNATTIGSHFKEKRAKNGFIQGIHYTDVVTSGDVTKEKLEKENFLNHVTKNDDGKYLLIGLPNDRLLASVLDRQTLNVDEADAFYIGALRGNGVYYTDLSPYLDLAQKALSKGLPAICSNPDYFAFHGNLKHVTSGSLGKWYEEHGGKVYWIGKPYSEIYQFALKKAGLTFEQAIMVGDTLRTDIMGGHNAGMRTVLITETGITADELKSGKEIADLCAENKVFPDYLLSRLK